MSDTFSILVTISPYFALEEAMAWMEALKKRAEQEGILFYVALPFDVLQALTFPPEPLILGGQFMNSLKPGSFTEKVSAQLLTSFGAKFVLLGTAEARTVEHETGEEIHLKVQRAKSEGLIPFLCIGETFEQYQQKKSEEILKRQIEEAIENLEQDSLTDLQVIYEAPWVHTAFYRPNQEEIAQAYQACRQILHAQIQVLYGKEWADRIKLFCPIPSDLSEISSFLHHIHADGFYLCNPHPLTSIDEEALRLKLETTKKMKEAATFLDSTAPLAEEETKEEATKKEEAEAPVTPDKEL